MNEQKYKILSTTCEYSNSRISTDKVFPSNYISTENMIPNRGGITSAESVPDAKTFLAYVPGNILLSNIRPYFKKIWFADKKGGCSNDVLVLKVKKDIDARFLYYVLSDNNFFNYSTVTSKGTKMPRGSKHAIMKYLVPDVDLPKQERIADILSAYDDLIDNNNKRIALLEKAAQELYKEWFVRFRFPGHETTRFINGLPEGWKHGHLKDTMSFSSGKVRPSSGCKYPVYGGNGILDYCDQYNSKNSIIVGRVGAYCGSVYYEPEKCWVSDNALYAVCDDNEIFYNYHLLRLLQLNKRQVGTGQPLITQSLLGKIKIIIPSSSVILLFNNIAGQFISQQTILNKQNQNLAKQRDLLLPRLMSGKLEV